MARTNGSSIEVYGYSRARPARRGLIAAPIRRPNRRGQARPGQYLSSFSATPASDALCVCVDRVDQLGREPLHLRLLQPGLPRRLLAANVAALHPAQQGARPAGAARLRPEVRRGFLLRLPCGESPESCAGPSRTLPSSAPSP